MTEDLRATPITASEVVERQGSHLQRILALCRESRRDDLRGALNGGPQAIRNYCLNRAVSKPAFDLAAYGTSLVNTEVLATLVIRWEQRLLRLASK